MGEAIPYEIEIEVMPGDIDQLGHVNNVVYLRWVQETAAAHWYARAGERDKSSLLWVVIRHEIDYKRPALEGDRIVARTWVGGATRRTFERFTELLRKSDMKILARARTLWCPVDAATKKPVDVGEDVFRRFSTHRLEKI
jgi:acyl-CoA thioester hydrolase